MPQKPVILETVSIYVLFKEIKQPREKLHKKGDNSYTPHKIKVNTAPAVSNCMAPILSHSYIHFTHFQKKSIFLNIFHRAIIKPEFLEKRGLLWKIMGDMPRPSSRDITSLHAHWSGL